MDDAAELAVEANAADAAEPAESGALEQAAPAEVRSDAPNVPWSIHMAMATRAFTRRPDGGVILHFTACVPTPVPGQYAIMPPRIDIPFSPDAWEAFKREVENDGRRSEIQVASAIPGGPGLPPGVRG